MDLGRSQCLASQRLLYAPDTPKLTIRLPVEVGLMSVRIALAYFNGEAFHQAQSRRA